MYSLRVCSTDDRELPPPEFGTGLTWDRLTEILRREIGSDAAALLAEPVHDAAHGRTDWHITTENDPILLSALSPTERNALVARLEAIRARVRERVRQLEAAGGEMNMRLAAAMAAVIEVPDEATHVWSVRGQPVLTAWGRRAGTAARPVVAIISRAVTPPHQESVPVVSPPTARMIRAARSDWQEGDAAPPLPRGAAAVAAAIVREHRPFRWPPALLWLLFLVLMGAIYYLLLAACALDVPVLRSVLNRCETAGARELDSLRARNSALGEAIWEAERRLALDCSDPARRHASRQPPRETPDSRQAEERVREAQGVRGRLDITLAWNGHQDLDLHVVCPGGEISYNTPEVCGGKLDIDRNASAPYTDTPVEHATWADAPPSGHYRVEVKYYDRRDAPEGPVPFTVVIRDGDNQRTFRGTVERPGETVLATEFQR